MHVNILTHVKANIAAGESKAFQTYIIVPWNNLMITHDDPQSSWWTVFNGTTKKQYLRKQTWF